MQSIRQKKFLKDEVVILKKLGHAVQSRRVRLNLTQEEAAHRARVQRTYMCQVEGGHRNITMGVLLKLAEGLEVTPYRLMQLMEKSDS